MGAVEQRLKEASIDTFASFTIVPMEEDVAIVSAIGRRYFEFLHRLDQLMPLLQTLEIEELVTETELDRLRREGEADRGSPGFSFKVAGRSAEDGNARAGAKCPTACRWAGWRPSRRVRGGNEGQRR